MTDSAAPTLLLPTDPYTTGDFLHFGQKIRRHIILWATHLGDDVAVPAGTPVRAIGDGHVVWSEMRLGSEARRNWGGIIVLEHQHENAKFYSIYGHMTDLRVAKGDHVQQGQQLGVIAPGPTPENGFWKNAHLHFAIYTGPWNDEILPGYKRPEEFRTKRKYWHDPRQFIARYNA